jgi:hypothetical protein
MFKHPVIITTNDNKRNNEQELFLLNKSRKYTLQHLPETSRGPVSAGMVLEHVPPLQLLLSASQVRTHPLNI